MSIIELFRKKTCDLLVNTNGRIVDIYRHFRAFLTWNRLAMGAIAKMEQTYYAGESIPLGAFQKNYDDLLSATRQQVTALNGLSREKYAILSDILDRIHREILPLFETGAADATGKLVLPMESLQPEMAGTAGSKATNLAVIGNVLGLTIPQGFVITAHAFHHFLHESGQTAFIREMLNGITADMTPEMEETCRTIQNRILDAEIPVSLANDILDHYAILEAKTRKGVRIAMRSSAVGEDTEASFAGQYVTQLNVTGDTILQAYKSVIAGKYSPGAILYRLHYGLADSETPMCAAAVGMVDAVSSGVMYTADPSRPESPLLKISSIWGLGEHLVSGEASPDAFYVNSASMEIVRRDISEKHRKMICRDQGGTVLEAVPDEESRMASIDDATVLRLADYGKKIAAHFSAHQDVEWSVDAGGRIVILQSRPLGRISETKASARTPLELPDHPVRLSGGKTASGGTASGRVLLTGAGRKKALPPDTILVTRFASPDHAMLMGKIRGIITDIGSVAGHLASVAREFGVPAIFDTGAATSTLKDGEPVTMIADTVTVYEGMIPEETGTARFANKHMIGSPVHRRMKSVIDRVSPLHLTDPKHPSFSPEGCRTVHDVIRFAHETAMKEMFGLSSKPKRDVTTVKLTSNIPLALYCIDLGGGLKSGLTTCDTVTQSDVESIPMKAMWRGFTHPGISWKGSVNFGFANLLTLMASSATAEAGADLPGGDSFAIFSGEYLNLSVRFGYHYANIDTFCGEDSDHNYIALQFSGGAGTYFGRSMRIRFLSEVLSRLGLAVAVTGDLLEADGTGSDRPSMERLLDQLGRLLAASRLLDMAIPDEDGIHAMTEAFFREDYDFLGHAGTDCLPDYYTHAGDWKTVVEAGRTLYIQDGSRWASSVSSGLANWMGRMVGSTYQEFLDNIRAYCYFPIAIARNRSVSDAVLTVDVQPVSGSIDRAGGLVFGLMNVGNYFVLRINALEDNFNLFEFVNDKRYLRASVHQKIETGKWYRIQAKIAGNTLKGYLNDVLRIEYPSGRNMSGYAGLWTKADSVTRFCNLTIDEIGAA